MDDKIKAIQDYLDGNLDQRSSEILKKEIESDPDLKKEFDRMTELHKLLSNSIIKVKPMEGFTDKVMQGIAVANRRVFNWKGLTLFLGIAITLIVSSILLSDSSIFSNQQVTDEINIPYLEQNIPSFTFNINWEIIINSFLFIGFFAAMIFLDITVLRPLFRRGAY